MKFMGGEGTNSLYLTQTLQLLLTQISKDQISVSVKFTFPVSGDTTVQISLSLYFLIPNVLSRYC